MFTDPWKILVWFIFKTRGTKFCNSASAGQIKKKTLVTSDLWSPKNESVLSFLRRFTFHYVSFYLLFSVEKVHDNVEYLEESSDDVHYDNGMVPLQAAVKQPAQVTVETGASLDVQNWADLCRWWRTQKHQRYFRHVVRKGRNWMLSALLESRIFFRSVLEAKTLIKKHINTLYCGGFLCKINTIKVSSVYWSKFRPACKTSCDKTSVVLKYNISDNIYQEINLGDITEENLHSCREHSDCKHDAGPW